MARRAVPARDFVDNIVQILAGVKRRKVKSRVSFRLPRGAFDLKVAEPDYIQPPLLLTPNKHARHSIDT